MVIDDSDPTWGGTAYANTLTFISFEGDVVQPGHEVRFVKESVGSCAGALSLPAEYGGRVDSSVSISVQLAGGDDHTSDGTYVLCLATPSSAPQRRLLQSISFNPAAYANSMTLTFLVTIGGVRQTSGTLVAYVGTTVSGMQDETSIPPFGAYARQAMY